MSHDAVSRRGFLTAASAAFGAAWLSADPAALRASLARAAAAGQAADSGAPLPPFEVLTEAQAADVDAVASQIVPTDDLPGAHEARVVWFIDHSLASWAQDRRESMILGLNAFNGLVLQAHPGVPRFALLTPAQQLVFLSAHENHPFFQQMIFATLTGMFSHPSWGGNFENAGYRVLGFENRYIWQPPFGWYDDKANGGPN